MTDQRGFRSWGPALWTWIQNRLIPTGSVVDFAHDRAEDREWLTCDGQAVSRTRYRVLFNAIGTTYGSGDGASTFNLPNLTDKFRRGGTSVGSTGGASSVTLTEGNLPTLSHNITDAGHNHSPGSGTAHANVDATGTGYRSDGHAATKYGQSSKTATVSTGITIDDHGSGSPTAVATVPPYVVLKPMIKT